MAQVEELLFFAVFVVGPIVVLSWAFFQAILKKPSDPGLAFAAAVLIAFISAAAATAGLNEPFFLLIACLGLLVLTLFLFKTIWLILSSKGKMLRIMLSLRLLLVVAMMVGIIWPWRQALEEFKWVEGIAKVSRAKSEIRNQGVALETYYIENHSYPPAVDGQGKIIAFSEDSYNLSSGYVPWLLTTPVAHNPSIPDDPFGPKGRQDPYWSKTYRCAVKAKEYWIMTSAGPDGDQDMILEDYIRSASGDIRLYLTQFGVGDAVEYDPTNGLGSSGDIFRTGP